MKRELNLCSPYKVYFDDLTFEYYFTTKHDVEYRLAFSEFNTIFTGTKGEGIINSVYNMLIDNVTEKKSPEDPNIKETVTEIVKNFFENKENCIIYTCDDSDQKEILRFRKFNSWFNLSDFKDQLIKHKDEFIGSGKVHYTSFIYHKENTQSYIIDESYKEIQYSLTKPQDDLLGI